MTSAKVKEYPTRKFLNCKCFSIGSKFFFKAFNLIPKDLGSVSSWPNTDCVIAFDIGAIEEFT